MLTNTLCVFIIVCFISDFSHGQRDEEFFRNDYTYIKAVNSSYKIHTTKTNWFEARDQCDQEGARLFYPENEDEQNAVMSFLNRAQPDIKWVFVGISNLTLVEVYEKLALEVCDEWKFNETDHKDGDEGCVEQDTAGKMNDCKCTRKFSFICKKGPLSLGQNNSFNEGELTNKELFRNNYTHIEAVDSSYNIHTTDKPLFDAWEACVLFPKYEDKELMKSLELAFDELFEMLDDERFDSFFYNLTDIEAVNSSYKIHTTDKPLVDTWETSVLSGNDYTHIEAVNSSYKIHTTKKTWFEARRQCAQEGARLFYPENEDEQNAVMSFLNRTQPDIKWVFLGIPDLTSEGVFETIDGKLVYEVKFNEPNNKNGDEDSVEQDNAGKMNDCKCSSEFSFICKKSPLSLEQNNSYNKDVQGDKAFSRNDYTRIETVNNSYKIHTIPKTWFEARQECAQEGARLFYPENEDEQNAVMSFLNRTQPDIKWVFLGIPDLTSEGVFETIDGKLVYEVKFNEPNNKNGDEDSVEQDNAGKMNDCKCSSEFSFICKKSPLSLEQNNSYNKDVQGDKAFSRNDYTRIETVNNSYKIHTIPKTWFEARQECAQEGARLFYPENKDEQNAVMSFLNRTQPDIKWVFVGISDLTSEGVFETIDGKLVSDVYINWKFNEPNNKNGDEDCVEQDNAGKMNDCKCTRKFSFICKKSPLSLGQNNSFNEDELTTTEFFWNNYSHIEAVNSSYNIHTTDKPLFDAWEACVLFPKYEDKEFMKSLELLTSDDVFETIDDELTNNVIFRNDYTHIEAAVNSSYKIHTTNKTWDEAKRQCAQEGASLFYPENEDEQNAVMSFLNRTQPDIKWVFVGISNLTSEGVFETIDEMLVFEVYNNWKFNEPNDEDGDEDCVEQDTAGKMNDCKCSRKFSFICKKSPLALDQNNSYNEEFMEVMTGGDD